MSIKTRETKVNGIRTKIREHGDPGRDTDRSTFVRQVAAALPRGAGVRIVADTPTMATIYMSPDEGVCEIDLADLAGFDVTIKSHADAGGSHAFTAIEVRGDN